MTIPVALSARELSVFPADYNHARAELRSQAQRSVQVRDTLAFPVDDATGADGEALTTETLWLGPRPAQNVVVLISALVTFSFFFSAVTSTALSCVSVLLSCMFSRTSLLRSISNRLDVYPMYDVERVYFPSDKVME